MRISDWIADVCTSDQSTEPYEDAEAHNHARVSMAVHDAVRMLGHDNPVSLLDPDGLYDRAVYTDMVVNQFNELKIFNESDDDDTTGTIIFDLPHSKDLRLEHGRESSRERGGQ